MSVEEINKESLRRLTEEVFNNGDISVLPELVSPDFKLHGGGNDFDLNWLKQFDEQVDARFSSAGTTIDNLVAEADRVAFQAHLNLTHAGPFMGVAPTGKKFEMTATHIIRISGGKVAEWWGTSEWPRVMQELGVVRPAGQ